MKKLITIALALLSTASMAQPRPTCADVSFFANSVAGPLLQGFSEKEVIEVACRTSPARCELMSTIVKSVYSEYNLIGGNLPQNGGRNKAFRAADITVSVLGCTRSDVMGTYRNKDIKPFYMDTAGTYDPKELQQALKDNGQDPGPIDGIIGSKTRLAIKMYEVSALINGGRGNITPELLNKLQVFFTAN